MQDLQLVGVHDDGEHVLLTGADGQRYRLLIDEPLRAAVRRDRARLGQLQIEMEGALRPRDIQARIRAGETAEDVATTAGLPVEHVRRYEGPVLAEREHVAQQAQRSVVRGSGTGRGPQLGELVRERLAARGVEGQGAWDAWRRDDGRWAVQLAFRAGSKDRRARWLYDPVRSTTEPLDDESRWLSSSDDAPKEGPIPGRRLSAVKERVYDVEADGGVREARRRAAAEGSQVQGADDAPDDGEAAQHPSSRDGEKTSRSRTVDLLEELRGRRGRRQPMSTPEEMAAADTSADPASGFSAELDHDDLPPAAHPPASQPHEAVDAEVLALPELPEEAGLRDTAVEPEAPHAPHAPDEAAVSGASAAASRSNHRQASRAKNKRPSVPSWDEIVFGAKKE